MAPRKRRLTAKAAEAAPTVAPNKKRKPIEEPGAVRLISWYLLRREIKVVMQKNQKWYLIPNTIPLDFKSEYGIFKMGSGFEPSKIAEKLTRISEPTKPLISALADLPIATK